MCRLGRLFYTIVVAFSISGGSFWAGGPVANGADLNYPPCPAPAAPPPCPTPPGYPTVPPSVPAPSQPTPAPEMPPTAAEATFASLGAGAGVGESIGLAAPNMIGHLLNASRSVMFAYARSTGGITVAGSGATSITNPNVSENNSPIPEDRVYYRYNFFDSSLSVTGIGNTTVPRPGNLNPLAPLVTRSYDVNMHTFGVEKTFFDRQVSVEWRVPFQTTLASKLDLSAGNVVGTIPGQTDLIGNPVFQVNPTPENTLGRENTEWGDMTLIFKGLLYQSPCWAFSAGLSVGIPTAPDTRVRVTDFTGQITSPTQASIVRQREFDVRNDNWSLSPFLAAVTTPTNRWFAQGFMQFDFPVTSNKITYTEVTSQPGFSNSQTAQMLVRQFPGQFLLPPFTVTNHIEEQILMHVDGGVGYWLVRNPSAPWITGIAPSLELHYTTTLENAQIVTLPGDGSLAQAPGGRVQAEAFPQVGNRRNRVDILDLTVGNTFEISNRATVATGFIFPLKRSSDRTFDWEFQLQLNYYFGGPRSRPPATF